MTNVTSADGTTIAYDRLGSGEPLILVGGALCGRSLLMPLATELAHDFDTIAYDRRGLGDSADNQPYTVQREVDDLQALLTMVGGRAAVYGHSSGAALAAIAASTGLPFTRVVLHDAPYEPGGAEPSQDAVAVLELLAAERHREAVESHLMMTGLPEPLAAEYATAMVAGAPTLAHDYAILDLTHGSPMPIDLLAKITQPTLVVAGSASPPFMVGAARRMTAILPAAELVELADQNHVVPPEILAPHLRGFLLPQ